MECQWPLSLLYPNRSFREFLFISSWHWGQRVPTYLSNPSTQGIFLPNNLSAELKAVYYMDILGSLTLVDRMIYPRGNWINVI